MNLYELNSAAEKILELLRGEKVDDKSYRESLALLSDDEKGETLCKMITQLKAEEDMYDFEMRRLADRKANVSKAKGLLRSELVEVVNETGERAADYGTFSVSLVSTHSVEILDKKLIPESFFIKQPPKVDKNKLRGLLSIGIKVPGAEYKENTGVRIR